MKNLTVSVIIPTYNREKMVQRAIRSVLNQTYKDFEVIVVDDGSTDNTDEVIKKFKEKDNRVRYIRHKYNKGAAAARNTGIKYSSGKYIAFLDSDDIWVSNKLEKQINTIIETTAKVGVVYTGTIRFMGEEKFYIPNPKIDKKEGNIYKNIIFGRYLVPTPSAVVKMSVLDRLGIFDENLPARAEWDLWIRISKYYHFKYIAEPLLISYYTHNSISTNRSIVCKALKLILKKHHKEFKNNKGALLNIYYKIIRLNIGDFLNKIGLRN